MGLGGISPVQLIIILIIVLLIFGTKKLRNFGGDLGGAIKGFKKAVKEEEGSQDKIEDGEEGKGIEEGEEGDKPEDAVSAAKEEVAAEPSEKKS